MNRAALAVISALILMTMAAPSWAQGSSTTRNVGRVDCSDLTLQGAARGTNGQDWTYNLAGVCRFLVDSITDGNRNSTREDSRGFATISASWNQRTNEAREQVVIVGQLNGEMIGSFSCSQNPFDTDIGCSIASLNSEGLPDKFLQQITRANRPFSGDMVDRDQARQMALASSGSAPPPPPPPPAAEGPSLVILPGLQVFATNQVFEGESLVDQVVGQGQASAQDMTQFGGNWSNNAHLFWNPERIGSLMSVPVNMGGSGAYRVTAHLTMAPDFARMRAYVRYVTPNGQSVDTDFFDFDAFSPSVTGPRQITIDVPNSTGAMTLVLITMGKNSASTGLFAGLDKVDVNRRN